MREIEQLKQGTHPPVQDKEPDYIEIAKEQLGIDLEQCPCCKTGKMKIITQFAANAPPIKINNRRKSLENSK